MKLLLTNDDGVDSDGIRTLMRILSKEHDVWVVAPDRNRSAVSHGISMSSPLRLRKLDSQIFSCSGVPVDCTVNGVHMIMPVKPDAVISGINHGANIGTDVLFSGTAAAARQASLYGIPGIALSCQGDQAPWDFESLAVFTQKNIRELISLCAQDIFVNVNSPSKGPYKGAELTTLSKRSYNDSIKTYSAPDGHTYSFFAGGQIHTKGGEENDFNAVENGYVSISRVFAQPFSAENKEFTDLKFVV